MRLQVEIAAASWTSGAESSRDAGGATLGQREPLAQLQRRGLVGDAEGEQLSSSARYLLALLVCSLGALSAKPASSVSSRRSAAASPP